MDNDADPGIAEQEAYIRSLTPQERLVLEIAADHLESSFDISKSLGFIQWKERQRHKKD